MKRKSELTVAIATAVFAVLGGTAIYGQDKYSLKSPSGIAFSDFKGYEDWAVVSSVASLPSPSATFRFVSVDSGFPKSGFRGHPPAFAGIHV